MAFRFRRSVSVLPGVRLNFGKTGVSASVGVRGASVTVGRRGVYGNVGLPGTGVSYRTRLDTPRGPAASRSTYRELARQHRELDRIVAREAAAQEHARHGAELDALRHVLRHRVRQPFSWRDIADPQPAFQPRPFTPPTLPEPAPAVERELAERIPRWPWAAAAVLCLLVAGLAPVPWVRVTGVLGVLAFAAMAALVDRRREAVRPALLERGRAEHERLLQRARAEHDAAEAERRAARELEEQRRERLRTAVAREDAEPLAELLADELANEELPLPLVFDLEFYGTSEVTIALVLPELDQVPAQRTSLTATGRLSVRSMAQRDRVGIYRDLCSGLCLRLVYETFRVLPMVERVEVQGIGTGTDPGTGHPREFVALRVAAGRAEIERLDLDRLEPLAAVQGLGGRFGCTARGELRSVR
jgi:hypothetical protein